jgi:AraC-like DNA-binding protein
MAYANGSGPTPPAALFLSTATLPARDRLPVWREVFGQTMVRLDIEPAKGTPFHAEGDLLALPGAALASVTVSPVRVSRTPRLIADDMADMMFLVTADAPLHVTQRGRDRTVDAGDAIFVRGSECSTIRCRDKARFINISVPAGDLMPMLANCEDAAMTVVSRRNDAFDLLMRYVDLLQTRRKPLSDELSRIAATHLRDLMAAMIETDPDRDPSACERRGVRAARLKAIKADIGGHLCEPGLSIAMIALRHGISPRYVRKLFQDEQTTFSDFVLLRRLERSRQLLRSPAHAVATIAAIAHACGFNDLSYFNRTFRRRYGVTPSDCRNGNEISARFSE